MTIPARFSGGKELRADQPDPRDLDTLLGELTLINARAELYLRFIRRRVSVSVQISSDTPFASNECMFIPNFTFTS